jgi:hypothetical protein
MCFPVAVLLLLFEQAAGPLVKPASGWPQSGPERVPKILVRPPPVTISQRMKVTKW